jgi:lipopolysaccharide export LptBFGC system permease protein LptF
MSCARPSAQRRCSRNASRSNAGRRTRRRRARRSVTRPRYLPSRDLAQRIEYFQRNGLDAGDFEEIYWGRWFYPLNVLALCLAAVPFAFGSLRSGGLGKRLFIGIVFALGFWMLQTLFGNLAQAFRFDIRVAYACPDVVMFGVSRCCSAGAAASVDSGRAVSR